MSFSELLIAASVKPCIAITGLIHVREMSGNFFFSRSGNSVMCQGNMKFCKNVRKMSGFMHSFTLTDISQARQSSFDH